MHRSSFPWGKQAIRGTGAEQDGYTRLKTYLSAGRAVVVKLGGLCGLRLDDLADHRL